MVSAMGLTACGQQQENSAAEDNKTVESASVTAAVTLEGSHMTGELTENVKIDAQVQGQEITSCTTYNTVGKEFDKNTMEAIFWENTSELKSEEDKEDNSYSIEDALGGGAYAYLGTLSYNINDSINDLSILAMYCYGNEMREMSMETVLLASGSESAVNVVDGCQKHGCELLSREFPAKLKGV